MNIHRKVSENTSRIEISRALYAKYIHCIYSLCNHGRMRNIRRTYHSPKGGCGKVRVQSDWLMRYLRRKRQLLAAVCTVILAGICLGSGLQPAISVSSEGKPLAGLRVMVDAGHGGYDGGACGKSGVWEKVINLEVAQRVASALGALGAEIVLTREDDSDLCTEPRPENLTKKRQDMIARVDMAKEADVNMVLSIHMNYYRDRGQSGPQVFYRKNCDAGRLLAGCLQESLIKAVSPRKERAALSGDYFILQLDVPSVLVECGFLSNPAEEKLLQDKAYQEKLAQGIAHGVAEYVSLAGIPQNASGNAE